MRGVRLRGDDVREGLGSALHGRALRSRSTMLARVLSLLAGVLWIAFPSRALAGTWSVQPAPAWVKAVEPADPASPAAAVAPNGGRYLLFDRQIRVGAVVGQQVESYTRWSRQITNEAGLQGSSQVRIDFDPTYETLAIHSVSVRRGSETRSRLVADAVKIVQREPNLEAQIFDGRQSAVLFVDDLRVGDIVEAAFTLTDADPTALGHFADAIPLGTPEPIARLHSRLVMTGGRPVRLLVHAPDGDRSPFGAPPVATPAGTEYEWDLRDIRAYVTDPVVPAWYVAFPWIQASDFESWSAVAAWAARLFRVESAGQGKLNEWVKATRRSLSSDDEFLLRAIRFVQDEIRYVGIETGVGRRRPTDPATVFDRRYGDCKDKATLLITLLRQAGIDAQPALVSTNQGHVLDEMLPSSLAFDHVIVRVVRPGQEALWVDATSALQGGGLDRLRYSTYERALVVGDRGGLVALTREPEERPSPSIRDRYSVSSPTSPEETKLESERVYEGASADAMRNQLRGKTSEQVSKLFMASYQVDFSTIREVKPPDQEDERQRNLLRVHLHFAIPKFWTFEASRGRYEAPLRSRVMESVLNRPPTVKRSAPLGVAHPLRMAVTIDVDVPFDLRLSPEESVTESRAFELRFESSSSSRRLSYAFGLSTRTPALAAAEVDAHLEKVDEAHGVLSRTLSYRPPAPEGLNWAGLVVLLATVPLICWGSYRAYRYEPKSSRRPAAPVDPRAPPDPRFTSIGGWLILLSLGIVLNPVSNLVTLVGTSRVVLSLATWRALTSPDLPTYNPALALVMMVEAVGLAACVTYGCAVAFLFFRRRRSFPFHFTIYAIAIVFFALIDPIAARALSKVATTGGEAGFTALRVMIWAAIWVTYVRTSQRAAATFVTRPPRRRSRRPGAL
ncbi:MAG: DUF3857 domain-containing protein [Labilithrix sp.]|nr:DUF3857 domain-containing protein [Labilithrix sp.]